MAEKTDQSKSMKTHDVTGGILLSKIIQYRIRHTSGDWSHHIPRLLIGGVICIRSMHNRKYTALHIPVRIYFRELF